MFQAVKWLIKMHLMELCPRNGEHSVLLTSAENCECTYVCIYIVCVCVCIYIAIAITSNISRSMVHTF